MNHSRGGPLLLEPLKREDPGNGNSRKLLPYVRRTWPAILDSFDANGLWNYYSFYGPTLAIILSFHNNVWISRYPWRFKIG